MPDPDDVTALDFTRDGMAIHPRPEMLVDELDDIDIDDETLDAATAAAWLGLGHVPSVEG